MTNSPLVKASSASFSSSAWECAKSPLFSIRLYWRTRSAWLVPLERKVKDCVRISGKGADRSELKSPGIVGVAYSLMPSIAPKRVAVGLRYSRVSMPDEGGG